MIAMDAEKIIITLGLKKIAIFSTTLKTKTPKIVGFAYIDP
jgi:hypothetical protein